MTPKAILQLRFVHLDSFSYYYIVTVLIPGIRELVNKKTQTCACVIYIGRGDRIRTCDPRFWRPMLWPAELLPFIGLKTVLIITDTG